MIEITTESDDGQAASVERVLAAPVLIHGGVSKWRLVWDLIFDRVTLVTQRRTHRIDITYQGAA